MMSNKQKERVAAKAFRRHMRKQGRCSHGDKLYTHTGVLVGTSIGRWRFRRELARASFELEPKWRRNVTIEPGMRIELPVWSERS